MQNRTVRRASGAGGAARTCVRARPALRRTVAPDRPATAFRLAAHDHRNKRMILWKYYICLRQCRSTALTLRTHLSPVTHSTRNTSQTGQTSHRSVHARHPGRRCTSRCQCLPVPQSRVPGSAHGYTPLPPGARGQRPWPCTMRHKAKATTHMAQGSHARSGTLYPNTLAACSCTRRLGGVTHLKGTRSREWCTVVWRGAPSYSRFEIDLDRLGQVPHTPHNLKL